MKFNNEIIIHTEQKDMTLSQLREMYDSNDIITNPDYQRKYIYNDKRASSLVESILIGIPIPTIYICEEKEGTFSVIDGQQRITSFVKYLKNEFSLSGLEKLTQLNGKFFKDLDKENQRKLKTKALKVISLDKDSQDLKYEIFARLNQGSVSLKPQELRNCIYRGSFNNMLKEIAKENNTLFLLFHDKNQRSAYEERILRFFVLRECMILNDTFVIAMNKYMEIHKSDDENQIQKLKLLFNGTIDIIKQVLGEEAFFAYSEKQRKKFNGAVYDSIMIPFSFYDKLDLITHADEIRKRVEEIKKYDKDYQDNVYAGTNARKKVFSRISKIWDILIQITGKNGMNKGTRFFSENVKRELFHPGYICSYCGNEILSSSDCEIDHIIPFSRGGATNIDNAQLLHRLCNQSKGNKIL